MRALGDGRVRCLLVRPEFLENTFYNPRDVFRLLGARSAAPPLGLLTVAAHLPSRWEPRFVDGDLGPVTDDDLGWADVLFISGKGPQEIPIRALADRAHARGIPVVVGGAGPTLQPEPYASIADYVVKGEAEPVLPRLFADLARGVSAGLYHSTQSADLSLAPVPRYDLAQLDQYLFVGMNFTRGCPFSCEFCAQIEIFGRKPRTKSVEQILREHEALYDLGYRGMIDFGYDNLIGDVPKAKAVLTAMRTWNRAHGHPFCYSTEATMNLARLPEVLGLMRDNDFRYVFMGIESADAAVLARTHKGQNTAMRAADAVRIVNAHGMVVNTGIIVGFDGEKDGIASRIVDMVQETGAFPTLVLPLHALPGTRLSDRLQSEGRLFRSGQILVERADRTDTATTGLNFVTERPRARVIRDLIEVLEGLYAPRHHYARIARITRQLRTSRRHRTPLRRVVPVLRALGELVSTIGTDRASAAFFWPALARALVRNPGALEVILGQAVMNANYARQARAYVDALRSELDELARVGEDAFHRERGVASEASPALQNR